jgi:Zn-dependent protease with chaperone function
MPCKRCVVRNYCGMNSQTSLTLTRFAGIAPSAWEHPADRAALQTLRAVPGFDQVVKKSIGFLGERGIRMMFQANAVRVSARQFPELHRLMNEVQNTLDWPEEVPLFVSQHPWFNAGAYGVDKPFIVLNSVTLDILEEAELRVLLGHELGHVMSGHALYRTMLALILSFGLNNLPWLTGFALLPIRLALQEWSRKSELSSDRAALLACQNTDDAIRMFLKAAGGTITKSSTLDLAAYKEQIADYEQHEGFDAVFKLLNLLSQTHPFHTLRAAELQRWSQSEEYRDILAGSYRRRTEPQTPHSYGADFTEAAAYYAGEAKLRAGEVSEVAKGVARQTSDYAKRAASEAKRAASEAKEAVEKVAENAAQRLNSAFERRR